MKFFPFAAFRGSSLRPRYCAAGPSLLPALARRTIVRCGLGIAATAAMLPLGGCDDQPRVAMAYIVDPTDSSARGRAEFRRDFQKIVVGGYLGKGEVAIVRADANPELLFAGPATQAARVNDALTKAEKAAPRMSGTNPAEALEISQTWLGSPQFKGWRRIVVIFSDMVPDATQTGPKPIIHADPLKFQWSPDVEIHIYGLPHDKHTKVLEAWKKLKTPPDLHQPFEALNPADLGLNPRAL